MKRFALLLILVVTAFSAAHAQRIPVTGPTPPAFILAGYRILPDGSATGDLNGDGRPDVALALGLAKEDVLNDEAYPPRRRLVLWCTAAGSYRLATVAREALLCMGCGGVHGDPFEGVEIRKGVLLVYHYGGSSWRWSLTARFRYQQGDFYQIGDTYHYTHTIADACPKLPGEHRPGDEYRDVNLLTGQYERVKVSDECRFIENKRGRQPVKPLLRLAAYNPVP